MAVTTVKLFTDANKTLASNIAGSKSWGEKKRENVFISSFAGGQGGGVSYTTAKTRSTVNIQGEIVGTGNNSDIGLKGEGMMVVSDNASGEKFFTRRGDFRQDELGFWKNGAGKILFAWKLDELGNLPQNSSLLSSLESVNFANTKGQPKATSSIAISMNLNAEQESLRGPGPDFVMKRGGKNLSTGKVNTKDIILPEQLTSSGLTLGDKFTFTSTPPNITKTIEYGAIAIGRAPSVAAPILGADSATKQFVFGNGANQVLPDSTVQIVVGATTYSFVAKQGAPNVAAREFNSIQSLANAINKTSGLTARVDSATGNLYIAPTNPDLAVTFTDGGGGTLVSALGLVDIALPNPADVKRFNSLFNLQEAVNQNASNFELKATIEKGDIKITALKATSDLKVTAESLGVRKIKQATIGNSAIKTQATVEITAPNHGLSTGDYVRLSNMGYGQLPNGVYFVSGTGVNGFTVNLLSNAPAAPPGALTPATGFAAVVPGVNTAIAVGANATWQKVPGATFNDITTANISGSVVAPGAHTVDITLLPGHAIVQDDIVYISGAGSYQFGGSNIEIPDGYYQVDVAADVLTILTTSVVVAPPGLGVGDALTVRKIGNVNALGGFGGAGANTFNSKVFETTVVNAPFVRMHLSNNNYNVGDYISFKTLPPAYVIDGIAISDDTKYRIVARTANTIDIEVTNPAGVVQLAAAGGIAGDYVTVGGPLPRDVGYGLQINNFSRTLEYFGAEQLTEDYLKTYNPDDTSKSLSGGNFNTKQVFTQTLKAYDSLGDEFNLLAHFAKLENNTWAVEISAIRDPITGLFDVVSGAADDGKILSGEVTFRGDGQVESFTGVDSPIQVTRNNGSLPTNLLIDWFNTQAAIKNGSVTQFSKANNFEFVQQDGQSAGTLVNVEINEEGFIVGTYDSGEVRQLYQIPVATFPNMNGLAPGDGGTYRITRESGDLLLKSAGSAGAASTLGGTLEAANTDTTEELLGVRDLSTTIQTNARAVASEFKNIETILAETRG